MRIKFTSKLLPEVRRGKPLRVAINGKWVDAYAGETVAAVLLAEGIQVFRHTARARAPRGVYCGMGLCYECLVTVNEVRAVRACVTPVADGMRIEIDPEPVL